ncbi:MAG: hypothetical protein Q8K00_18770 [Syntrophales bacterium]|nr:hypothetical protein [Syntrophales bacterium]
MGITQAVFENICTAMPLYVKEKHFQTMPWDRQAVNLHIDLRG